MKIERVNENQIRCTLTREDLENRQIELSELAYGTEKARNLFRDMMQQANSEFGFEADNGIPLMVEAVPLSGGNIILMITKVDYPEELDTRFSKFTDIDEFDAFGAAESKKAKVQGVDDILDIFKKMHDDENENVDEEDEEDVDDSDDDEKYLDITNDIVAIRPIKDEDDNLELKEYKSVEELLDEVFSDKVSKKNDSLSDEDNFEEEESDKLVDIVRMYEFSRIESIIRLGKVLKRFYNGENNLYKNTKTKKYNLILHKNNHSPKEYNKICNVVSEYGKLQIYSKSTEAFLREHNKLILEKNALEVLSELD
ncbi:adaptor protein MecA [Lachnobacterium bovis]|uniref:adaptor protein MecA n=1 Tax=Lachnobacterium bovis TaxID=140626 RepID=UPI00048F13B6|nr:adaptor protein MecA [Lachnobacterium bovis]